MIFRSIASIAIMSIASLTHAIDVSSRIDRVIVYPEGATVSRIASVDLSAGLNNVRLTGLVESIDMASLRLEVTDAAVEVGQVRLDTEQQRAAYNEQVENLRAEIDALTLRITAIDDNSNAARLRLKFLDGLAQGYAKEAWLEGSRGSASVDSLRAALDLLQSGADDANQLIRENNAQKANLSKDLSLLNRRLEELRGGGLAMSVVEVTLNARVTTRTDIRLLYAQAAASWSPRYEARLDSNTGNLQLAQQADVYQQTDEDWANVRMVLSTSTPSGALVAPDLQSQFLDIYEPRPENLFSARAPASAKWADEDAMLLEEVVVSGARPARIDAGNFAVNYEVPGRVSVSNTVDDAIVVDLAMQQLAAELVTQVVPRESDQAFLAARLSYDGTVPLYGGQMAVYVDGVFSGNTAMPGAQPGETIVLPMGQDRRVSVKVENQGGLGGVSGVISKRRSEVTDYLFEITNRRSTPSFIEVTDLYPVSRNDDVEVDVPKTATAPDEQDIKDRPGVVVWKKTLEPGETWRIRHQYTISYPADMILRRM